MNSCVLKYIISWTLKGVKNTLWLYLRVRLCSLLNALNVNLNNLVGILSLPEKRESRCEHACRVM